MANRRESRFDDRWRENPNRSYPQAQDRNEYERRHLGQLNQSDSDVEFESRRGQEHWEEPVAERPRRVEQWSQRGQSTQGREYSSRHQGQRTPEQDEEFRDRPYASSTSFEGDGGFVSHNDPYRQGRDRGFGADSTGATWGEGDTSRHRLGSLTDSAAASARRVEEYRRSEYSGVSHAGKGPKGYKRSDERVREDVCEHLTRHHEIDASNIEVSVTDGTVFLSGTAEDRRTKRLAEDIAHEVSGAVDVQNQIRIQSVSTTGSSSHYVGRTTTEQPATHNTTSVLGLNEDPINKK